MSTQQRTIRFEHQGTRYEMAMGDFTALDDKAILELFNYRINLGAIFAGATLSLSTLAALVWRWRVSAGETGLTYEQVAATFTYDTLSTVRDADDDPDDAPSVPKV